MSDDFERQLSDALRDDRPVPTLADVVQRGRSRRRVRRVSTASAIVAAIVIASSTYAFAQHDARPRVAVSSSSTTVTPPETATTLVPANASTSTTVSTRRPANAGVPGPFRPPEPSPSSTTVPQRDCPTLPPAMANTHASTVDAAITFDSSHGASGVTVGFTIVLTNNASIYTTVWLQSGVDFDGALSILDTDRSWDDPMFIGKECVQNSNYMVLQPHEVRTVHGHARVEVPPGTGAAPTPGPWQVHLSVFSHMVAIDPFGGPATTFVVDPNN